MPTSGQVSCNLVQILTYRHRHFCCFSDKNLFYVQQTQFDMQRPIHKLITVLRHISQTDLQSNLEFDAFKSLITRSLTVQAVTEPTTESLNRKYFCSTSKIRI